MSSHSPSAAAETASGRRVARKVERRCAYLLELLGDAAEHSVEDLIGFAGASPATVRRDLRRLERRGLVRRTHGLVSLAGSAAFEPFLDDPGFRHQLHSMSHEKRRIAAAAAALIDDGETIGIAPGTTTDSMSRLLKDRRGLVVVTNALNIAMELSRQKHVTVHLTGGYLSGDWFAMVGPRAQEFIATMFTDKFFFGANGIHGEHGVTDRHPEEAAVNAAMARQARKRILLVDHTKFGQTARCLVCPVRDVHMIITDTGVTAEMAEPFERLGIEVLRV